MEVSVLKTSKIDSYIVHYTSNGLWVYDKNEYKHTKYSNLFNVIAGAAGIEVVLYPLFWILLDIFNIDFLDWKWLLLLSFVLSVIISLIVDLYKFRSMDGCYAQIVKRLEIIYFYNQSDKVGLTKEEIEKYEFAFLSDEEEKMLIYVNPTFKEKYESNLKIIKEQIKLYEDNIADQTRLQEAEITEQQRLWMAKQAEEKRLQETKIAEQKARIAEQKWLQTAKEKEEKRLQKAKAAEEKKKRIAQEVDEINELINEIKCDSEAMKAISNFIKKYYYEKYDLCVLVSYNYYLFRNNTDFCRFAIDKGQSINWGSFERSGCSEYEKDFLKFIDVLFRSTRTSLIVGKYSDDCKKIALNYIISQNIIYEMSEKCRKVLKTDDSSPVSEEEIICRYCKCYSFSDFDSLVAFLINNKYFSVRSGVGNLNDYYEYINDKVEKQEKELRKQAERERLEKELFSDSGVSSVNYYKISDIDKLSGDEFEKFISILFEKMGYFAHKTQSVGDQGVDVIAENEKEKIAIQAKRYNNATVGNKAIQEVVAGMKFYNCNKAMVVTNSSFTVQAVELARVNNVELWDRKKLMNTMSLYAVEK